MKKVNPKKVERTPDEMKRYFNTQGFKKLWNLFLAISETDEFKQRTAEVRDKYSVPKNGFSSYEEMRFWDNLDTDSDDRVKRALDISKEIKKICDRFNFHFLFSEEVIEHFLFFNECSFNRISEAYNLCRITDSKENKDSFELNIIESSDVYPISLGISPDASLRDILDYVKKVYKIKIKPLQKKYRVVGSKVGKVKSKNEAVQERNKFIYENRNLPRKKIREMVKDKFGIMLDYEYVGKIISDEKKKRKEL